MRNDFAIFICTHGRPDAQLTLNLLKTSGYTGKWYLVVDDTDKTIQQYIDNYGADRIIVFNKNHYINSDKYDNGDNKLHAKCILYAKRAVEDIAKAYGYTYFIIADDDITKLNIRYSKNNKLCRLSVSNLDALLSVCVDFVSETDITGLGFGHVALYFSGIKVFMDNIVYKKWEIPYQFILRNGNKPVNWTSWFAEDDITEFQSCLLGNVWMIILQIMFETQPVGNIKESGGMVDTYKNNSSYNLGFNAVKYCPQRISLRNHRKNGKIVLNRNTEVSFPKIVSWRYKKCQ